MNVAQTIIASLEQYGVKRAYGLIGTSILDLLDAAKDSKIRYISTRHEQVAVSMADAQGRLSERPGVAFIHGGPGVLNSLISIADAYKDSSPILVIAGAVKRRLAGQDSWLEVPQQEMVRHISKSAYRIEKGSEAARTIAEAYSDTLSPPKGPVFVEVPEDVWRLDGGNKVENVTVRPPPEINAPDVSKVSGLLRDSQRPILLAGGGVNNPSGAKLLRDIAERCDIPVATTGNGRGALPEDHPLSLGRAGFGGGNSVADFALKNADLLIAVGAGVSDVTTYGFNLKPMGEIIAIDINSSESKSVAYRMHLQADATSFLQLLSNAELPSKAHEEWHRLIDDARASWKAQLNDSLERRQVGHVNPSKFFGALDARLPPDVIVTAGQGLHILYAYDFLTIRTPRSFLAATNLGAMGFAFPAALGAKVECQDREVVGVLGDGEFLMTLQDLETAVRERIGVKIIVVNDNSYRVLLMRQRIQKMGRIHGTLHTNPEMTKLAAAFGAEALSVLEDSKIDEAVEFVLTESEIPRIVELKISPEDLPPLNMEASLKF